MGKFNEGDKVRILKGSGSAHEGKVGTVADPHWQISQSDWPLVKIDVGDGKYAFPDEDYCELAEDPYEYAVEWTVKGSDTPVPITADRWVQRDSAERMIEFNERMFTDKMQEYTVKLVKRKKAGEIEDAS
jgi:hypothetical protein